MSDATDGDADRELAETVDELADALRELREEIDPRRTGPLGLPAPPTPGELLRFADRRAIPFAIAVLEANIRALELLQGAIRLADSGRAAGQEAERARSRAASLGRSTLQRLETVLADLEEAADEGALPRQDAARDVLEEARRLRTDVEDALASSADDRPGDTDETTEIDVESPDRSDREDPEAEYPEVDVENELESIKRELGKLEDRAADSDPAEGDTVGDDNREETRDPNRSGDGTAADGGDESTE